MEQFRKYDAEEDRIVLDSKYLFAFTKTDGFSERLLRAQLLINYEYEYNLELKAFQHERKTNNHSDYSTEKGMVTGKLLDHFERLLLSDYLTLKKYYDFVTLQITDVGQQQYLINLEPKTVNINILDGLPEEYFKSETEKILYEFNEFLKNWIEEKYQYWIRN